MLKQDDFKNVSSYYLFYGGCDGDGVGVLGVPSVLVCSVPLFLSTWYSQ